MSRATRRASKWLFTNEDKLARDAALNDVTLLAEHLRQTGKMVVLRPSEEIVIEPADDVTFVVRYGRSQGDESVLRFELRWRDTDKASPKAKKSD